MRWAKLALKSFTKLSNFQRSLCVTFGVGEKTELFSNIRTPILPSLPQGCDRHRLLLRVPPGPRDRRRVLRLGQEGGGGGGRRLIHRLPVPRPVCSGTGSSGPPPPLLRLPRDPPPREEGAVAGPGGAGDPLPHQPSLPLPLRRPLQDCRQRYERFQVLNWMLPT